MKLTRSITCALALAAGAMALGDEAGERQAIIDTVQELFDAMQAADGERLRTVLTPSGMIFGYRQWADGIQLTTSSHHEFIDGLVTSEREFIERFWDPQVLIHDHMATVWTPYDLWIDGAFSHCGIDSFQLVKADDRWKIAGILYSVEREGCAESPLGPLDEGESE